VHFEWDEEKNRENIRKHGLDFADAAELFEGPMWVRPDLRFDYGEQRFIGIGAIGNRIILVAFTELDDDTIRIISLRRATNNERSKLEKRIKD
jgi:uncharacterized DUF497 family protein